MSSAQKAKLIKALDKLQPGKRLNLMCPQCKKKIELAKPGKEKTNESQSSEQFEDVHGMPQPPDMDWLKEDYSNKEEKEDDIPMALILFPEGKKREELIDIMKSVGYRIILDDSAQSAIEKMRYVNFSSIVLHSNFEGAGLEESLFHGYMKNLQMNTRRYIFYLLIGKEFKTFYNLEALCHSANLVVNENDISYLDMILRQAIPAHEELFGPLMDELKAYGKK